MLGINNGRKSDLCGGHVGGVSVGGAGVEVATAGLASDRPAAWGGGGGLSCSVVLPPL
jgi:hypothetical protein